MLVAVVIAAATVWVLYAVWRSKQQNALATYWGFAVTVVALVAGWIRRVWRRTGTEQDEETPGLDALADQLAERVRRQWEEAARERLLWPEPIPVRWRMPSKAMAGPVATASRSTRFHRLPGLRTLQAQDPLNGDEQDLHGVYGGLGSGRLVITGAPGSGKSGAAILLVLAALRHRKSHPEGERQEVPVLVMFTLHGWDPNTQPVNAWLAARLRETYPLFGGKGGAAKAAALVNSGRLAFILDGLDEIAVELRPVALQALSGQADFRMVVLGRTDETLAAASQQFLMGAVAVELQEVDPKDAADYLESVQLAPVPKEWGKLIDRIRHAPHSPLARALSSPLTLTLVRDTCHAADDVRTFLNFCYPDEGTVSREDIEDYLLDRVLPAAYNQRPGQRPLTYDLQTAQNVLSRIAAEMNRHKTKDLRWWEITGWLPSASRARVSGLIAGLAVVIATGLGFGLLSGVKTGVKAGIWAVVLAAIPAGGVVWIIATLVGEAGFDPHRIGPFQWREVISRGTLITGGVIAFMGLTGGIGVGDALVFGVAGGLGSGILAAVGRSGESHADSLTPLSSWHEDLRFWLVIGLGWGFLSGLALGLLSGIQSGLATGLAIGTVVLACGAIVMFLVSGPWLSSLAFAQLAFRWHTPIRIIRFLEDSRQRNVLRTIGPTYQFRHARLQDRLAEQAPSRYQLKTLPRPRQSEPSLPPLRRPQHLRKLECIEASSKFSSKKYSLTAAR